VPYIKYRGGRAPESVKEAASYEDPSALCHQGLAKLSADARRFTEELHSDGEGRAGALRSYVANHPYPGLEHVGGVGFVEGKALRAIDEEITAEEYEQLRGTIRRANDEYRAKKTDNLLKNNDPLRRASSVHEELGWRTRVCVASHTELEHHVAYPLSEGAAAYLRVRQETPSGATLQLIDIYHDGGSDIEEALLEGTDYADMLADFLALVGYGAAHIVNVLGTTVPYCRVAEEFEIATFGASVLNTPVPVHPDQFGGYGLDQIGRLALRHLREGLSAPLPTAAFVAFWNALERQAEEEARAKNLPRLVKCKDCGAERAEGWDLKKGFEAMYAEAGLDPSLFDGHRKRRGVIQHGAKLPTASYIDEVFQDLSQVQAAAVVAVAKRVGVAPGTITYLSTSWPVAVFACRAHEDRTVEVTFRRTSVRAGAGVLPQRVCGDAGRTVELGVSLPPKINPLALPPVQR